MKTKIADLLQGAESVVIYPHIQMDGDALGSSVALCKALRNLGKKAEILIEDKIPNNIKFLDQGYCVYKQSFENPDLVVALDSSDSGRLGKRFESYKQAEQKIMIDHHKTAKTFGDYNLVDVEACATGEIVMDILKIMEVDIDKEIAEALYTALVTDTGRFMYSNTKQKTHLQAAELYDRGIDQNKISVEIYQKVRLEKVKLRNEVMSSLEMFANNKACIAFMTLEMLEKSQALPEETEGLVEELRNIEGIEVAVILKEEEKEKTKGTFRSKGKIDVSKITENFGGGGHKNAAGCTVNQSIETFKPKVIKAIEEAILAWKTQE